MQEINGFSVGHVSSMQKSSQHVRVIPVKAIKKEFVNSP